MTDSLSEKLKDILTIDCKDISGIDINEYDDKSSHSAYHRYINGYILIEKNKKTSDEIIAKYITVYTNEYLKDMLRGKIETDVYIKYLPLTFVFEIFEKHNDLRKPILKELPKSTRMFSNNLLFELYKAITKIDKCDKTAFLQNIKIYEENLKKEQENLKNEKNESLLLILNNDKLAVKEKLTKLLTIEYKPKFIDWMIMNKYNDTAVITLFGEIEKVDDVYQRDINNDIEESISNKIKTILEGNDDDKKNKLLDLIREMLTPPPIGGSNRKKKRTKKYKKKRSRKIQTRRKMQTRTRRKMHRKPSSIRRKN